MTTQKPSLSSQKKKKKFKKKEKHMGDIRDDQSIGWVNTYTVYHLIYAKFCENYKNLRTSLAAYFKMNEI